MAVGLCILPPTPPTIQAQNLPWYDDDDDDDDDKSFESDTQRGAVTLRSLSINLPRVSPSKPLKLAYLAQSPPTKPVLAKSQTMAPRAAPPPPPPRLRAKKAIGKLKRSIKMVKWYQTLKRKLEGQMQQVKNAVGKKTRVGGGQGKQGLDEAIAEMMKRSAYFQRIEEDVNKHWQEIMQLKTAINSFRTNDMSKLVRFQKDVERTLEKLTDETKVLTRFEDFPIKKLESLREATALYLKVREIIDTLQNWKIEPPLGDLLDKVESYFNKIKLEIEAVERNKDEMAKRFESNNISFDFNILVRVKESMVDVSSGFMELALKERRGANEGKRRGTAKQLWRAFQLAYRIYTFAGGQDDRADRLTEELAKEIETEDIEKF